MRYNVTLVDPATYKFAYLLADVSRVIASGLRSLGYRCDLTTNNIDSAATNIIVGTHLLTPGDARAIIDSGARYIALHTEWLSPGDPPYSVKSTFQGNDFESRQREFLERAEAIWEAWESNIQLLSLFDIPPERFRRYWTGYHVDLEEIRHRSYTDKDIDALFVGAVTPRRQAVLNELGRTLKVTAAMDLPHPFRNDLIARAKINLALFSDPALNYFSFLRIGYALNNRAFILSEPSVNDRGMQELVMTCPAEQLVERCRSLIDSGEIPRAADEAYELYREKWPITRILRELI
jgi:hypothetical protein